jgi:hypothetical protein
MKTRKNPRFQGKPDETILPARAQGLAALARFHPNVGH